MTNESIVAGISKAQVVNLVETACVITASMMLTIVTLTLIGVTFNTVLALSVAVIVNLIAAEYVLEYFRQDDAETRPDLDIDGGE